MKSLGEAVERLSKAAGLEGGKVWETLQEKYPEVGKALGSGGEELQKLGEKQCVLLDLFLLASVADVRSLSQRTRSSSHRHRRLRASLLDRRQGRNQRKDSGSDQEARRREDVRGLQAGEGVGERSVGGVGEGCWSLAAEDAGCEECRRGELGQGLGACWRGARQGTFSFFVLRVLRADVRVAGRQGAVRRAGEGLEEWQEH